MAEIVVAAGEGHLAPIRALFGAYERELDTACCFEGFEHELAHLAEVYALPGFLLLMVDRGTPAGCVGLRAIEPGVAEMKRLYVVPEFRGAGLGGALVVRLLAEARAAGLRAVQLETLPDKMPEALALYRALGFQEIPPYVRRPLAGAVYMELQLRPG